MCEAVNNAFTRVMMKGVEKGKAEGKAEGIAEGKAEGQLLLLHKLIKNGTLTLEKAAESAETTTEELKNGFHTLGLDPL